MNWAICLAIAISIVRDLLGTRIHPTRSAPLRTAVSAASRVFTPQILTSFIFWSRKRGGGDCVWLLMMYFSVDDIHRLFFVFQSEIVANYTG